MKGFALVLVVLLPLAASAATIRVSTTADNTTAGDDECTLREAIANVNAAADTTGGDCGAGSGADDTIVFNLPLPATITLTMATALVIGADVTINGPATGPLALDGNGQAEVLFIAAGTVSIANLAIQNGLSAVGGGIYSDGTLTLTNCTLSGNAADDGGGLYNDIDGTAVLTDCTLDTNTAGGHGGGISNEGILTATNCTLIGNAAGGSGGGVSNDGTLTLTSCTLSGDTAANGGGVYNDGVAMLSNCTLTGNTASYSNGGGVDNDIGGTAILTNCALAGNVATCGGGGGVYNGGTLTLSTSMLIGNTASFGSYGISGGGGGVANDGLATLNDCTLSGNSAFYADGGGVANHSTMTLTNCTLFGNSVNVGEARGGGIANDGMVTLIDCTLSRNSARGVGGGVHNNQGTAILTNCTLFGNTAGGNDCGGGGGVYDDNGGTVTLTNCTLSGNSAFTGEDGNPGGGNLYVTNAGGTRTTLANTIVADSIGGGNCVGGIIIDAGHNLDSDGTCGIGPATDPKLDPADLANNGGPTQTLALQAGSPAINAGDESICSAPPVNNLDQRGVVRPAAGSINCSIGAYEYEPVPPLTPTTSPTITPTPTSPRGSTITVNSTADDSNGGNGQCTLREAITNVNASADTTNGDCTAGTGMGDSIVFSLTLPATIALTTHTELAISSDVSINGPSASLLALDGNGQTGVFAITAGTVSISNVTIQNGSAEGYGGVYNDGTVTLVNCTLSGNNSVENWGGGIYNDIDGTAILTNSTLAGNSADLGGAVYNQGIMTLSNCALVGNAGIGGGVANDGTLTLSSCTLSGNSAEDGGAVYNDVDGTAILTDCTLTANTAAANDGGAIDNEGTLTLANCTLNGNSALSGGGVYNNGTLTMTRSTLIGNAACYYSAGGGVYNDIDGTATLTDCTLSFNSASVGAGGGVYNDGTLTLSNCTLSGNLAEAGGGGVFNDAMVTMTGCTLSGNSAPNSQGGGGVLNDGTAILTNCTLLGNSTGGAYSAGGGGLFNDGGAALTLTNCTLSGNSAPPGEGGNLYISNESTTATLANTIVANSIGGGNCAAGTIINEGNNLDSDGTCGVGPVTDPLLDPAGLASNGGPTQTIALQADSPAINGGDESICSAPPVNKLDQRGYPRPGMDAANCSVGAYEFNSLPAATATWTAAPTATPTQASTPANTATVSPTPVLTQTGIQTPTSGATATPTASPSATPTNTAAPCAGDCDGSGTVTVNEIITLVNLALGNADLSACPHGSASAREVTITLIIQAVNSALNGCA